MSLNTSRINRSFTPTEVTDLSMAFATVDQIFDFHQGASPLDISRMLRIGTENLRFVREIKVAVDDFPIFLPGFLPQANYDAGFELYFQLSDLEAYLKSLLTRTNQTRLIAGHHLMRDSLDIYGNMQHANRRGISGVAPYLAAAEIRFESQGSSRADNGGGTSPAADNGGTPPVGPANGPTANGGSNPPTSPNPTPTGGSGNPTQDGGGTASGSNQGGGGNPTDANQGGGAAATDPNQGGGGSSSDPNQGGGGNPGPSMGS